MWAWSSWDLEVLASYAKRFSVASATMCSTNPPFPSCCINEAEVLLTPREGSATAARPVVWSNLDLTVSSLWTLCARKHFGFCLTLTLGNLNRLLEFLHHAAFNHSKTTNIDLDMYAQYLVKSLVKILVRKRRKQAMMRVVDDVVSKSLRNKNVLCLIFSSRARYISAKIIEIDQYLTEL